VTVVVERCFLWCALINCCGGLVQRVRVPGNGLNHTAVSPTGDPLHTVPPAAKRVRSDEPSNRGLRLEI